MSDPREEINNLIVDADRDFQNGLLDEGMLKLQEAETKAQEIEWNERVVQIQEIRKDTLHKEEERKNALELEKKLEEERKLKEEKDKRLELAKQRLDEKRKNEKLEKLNALRKKKEEEEKLQNDAYDLLAAASDQANNENFDAVFVSMDKAKQIFTNLNWPTEIRRADDMLADFQKRHQVYLRKVEEEQQKTQQLEEAAEKQQKLISSSQIEQDKERKKESAKLDDLSKKRELEDKLSSEAFSLMDEGNNLAKEQDFTTAIEKFKQAKELFSDIGWTNEADKTLLQISNFKKEKKKIDFLLEKKQEEQEKARIEEEKLQKQIEISRRIKQKENDEEQQKLDKQKEDKAYADKIGNEVYANIDLIETKIKLYEDKVKSGKILELECPYSEAISVYRNSAKELRDIGWLEQSERLSDGMREYQKKLVKDEQLRVLEQKRIDQKKAEQEELEKQIRLSQRMEKRKEEERHAQFQEEQAKINQEQQVNNECLELLEQAKKLLESNAFEDALNIYKEVAEMYRSIDYSQGVQLTEDTIYRVTQDYEKFVMQKEVQQKLAQKKQEQEQELQQQIQEAKSEAEKKKFMEQQRLLEIEEKRIHEEQTQNQIIDLLEQAGINGKNHEYDAALGLYTQALALFDEIQWPLKQQQVHESIIETKKMKEQYLKKQHLLEEKRIKETAEQEALQAQLREEEEKKQALQDAEKKRMMEQRSKAAKEKELESAAWKALDEAEKLIKKGKTYLALDQLLIGYSNFSDLGWKRESDTTHQRMVQVLGSASENLLSLDELLHFENQETIHTFLESLQNTIVVRIQKRFDESLKTLNQCIQLLTSPPVFSRTVDKLQNLHQQIQEEHNNYEIEQEKLRTMPSEANANRLFETAKKYAEDDDFQSAIEYGEKSQEMFDRINLDRQARIVQQEIVRWKFRLEKLDEQIHQISSSSSEDSLSSSNNLSEEERLDQILKDRAEQRRARRSKDN